MPQTFVKAKQSVHRSSLRSMIFYLCFKEEEMLTNREREVVVDYLFNSDIAFLVENMMLYMPEEILRKLANDLLEDV